MTWAGRRRLFIILLVFGAIFGLLFWHFKSVIYVAPTCTDGKQNADEVGVDCGGGCVNFCDSQIKDIIVLWRRAFPVTDSVYNAVAYIENDNDAVIQGIPYEFRLYDEEGSFVARVQGNTNINPSGRYAIVETGIKVGNKKIAKTTFEFGKPTVPWLKVPSEISKIRTTVNDVKITDADTVPKVSATIANTSPTISLSDFYVSAILFDADNNAINASKTFVENLPANSRQNIFFSWPKPLGKEVTRYEIIPLLDLFHTKK